MIKVIMKRIPKKINHKVQHKVMRNWSTTIVEIHSSGTNIRIIDAKEISAPPHLITNKT